MAPTGMYPLLGYSWELKVPVGVQAVDGVEGARKAVREQVMYGADWIKYYSDRRYHFGDDGVLYSMVNFTDEEAKAIVDETHRLGKKVAAHCIGSDGIAAALRAGVDTIEHGDGFTDALLDEAARKGVYWVPTIMVGAYVAPGRGGNWVKMVDLEKTAFQKASEEKCEDCARNRCRRLRLERIERSGRVCVLRELRHDADAGDSRGHGGACGAAWLERQSWARSKQGSGRTSWRSAAIR